MGYSNSKSVSSYAFGIPTDLYSIHGSIKVTQCQVVGRERRGGERTVHGRRRGGGEAKAPRVAGLPLNRCLELVPSICQREALQLLFMVVLTHHATI
jgi:hypothetical protein